MTRITIESDDGRIAERYSSDDMSLIVDTIEREADTFKNADREWIEAKESSVSSKSLESQISVILQSHKSVLRRRTWPG